MRSASSSERGWASMGRRTRPEVVSVGIRADVVVAAGLETERARAGVRAYHGQPAGLALDRQSAPNVLQQHGRLGADPTDELVVVSLDVGNVVLDVPFVLSLRARPGEDGLHRAVGRRDKVPGSVRRRLGEALVLTELIEGGEDPVDSSAGRLAAVSEQRTLRDAPANHIVNARLRHDTRPDEADECEPKVAAGRHALARHSVVWLAGQYRPRQALREGGTHVWSSPPSAELMLDQVASQSLTTAPWKLSSPLRSVFSRRVFSQAWVPFSELPSQVESGSAHGAQQRACKSTDLLVRAHD